ncbi:hypothetical protein F8S13_24880 [Chloroflexia bacterium SDU3-3]|nr:hypothetical protein F8S13_24880 [Chloroflexia bacterium SDU3-3]
MGSGVGVAVAVGSGVGVAVGVSVGVGVAVRFLRSSAMGSRGAALAASMSWPRAAGGAGTMLIAPTIRKTPRKHAPSADLPDSCSIA